MGTEDRHASLIKTSEYIRQATFLWLILKYKQNLLDVGLSENKEGKEKRKKKKKREREEEMGKGKGGKKRMGEDE